MMHSHPPAPSLVPTREGEQDMEGFVSTDSLLCTGSPSLIPMREGAGGWENIGAAWGAC